MKASIGKCDTNRICYGQGRYDLDIFEQTNKQTTTLHYNKAHDPKLTDMSTKILSTTTAPIFKCCCFGLESITLAKV